MDNVSSLECLKSDSQSEVLDKDGAEKGLFSPAFAPLNCDTPIETRAEEPETTEPTEEELFYMGLRRRRKKKNMSAGSETEESEYGESLEWIPESEDEVSDDWKSEDWKSKDWKSEDEESEDEESEVEESEDENSEDGSSYGECKVCLKVVKRPTELCSYMDRVPKNAIVGESCVVACLVCGCLFRDSCCANCGLSKGRALFKECTICGKKEEHESFDCPERKEKHKDSGFTCNPYNGSFSVKIRGSK